MKKIIKLNDSKEIVKASDVTQSLKELLLSKEAKETVIAEVHLVRIEEGIKNLRKDEEIKKHVKEAVEELKGNEPKLIINGAELTISPTKTSYDFSECGDVELDALYIIQERLKTIIKAKEEELKLIEEGRFVTIGEKTEVRGGKKNIICDGEVIKNFIEFSTEKYDYLPLGETLEVKRPNKEQSIGVKISKK